MLIVILIRYIQCFYIYKMFIRQKSIKCYLDYRIRCYNAHCKVQHRDVSDYV